MKLSGRSFLVTICLSVIFIIGTFAIDFPQNINIITVQASESIDTASENNTIVAAQNGQNHAPVPGQRPDQNQQDGQNQSDRPNRGSGYNQGSDPNTTQGNMPNQGFGQRGPGGQNTGMGRIGSTNTKYAVPLLIYSVLFMLGAVLILYLYKVKKIKIKPGNESKFLLLILCTALIARLVLANTTGGHNDLNLFRNWASTAAKNLLQVYSGSGRGSADYPPLYIYVLSLLGKLIAIPGFSSFSTLLMKLPSILADIGTAYLIYRMAKGSMSKELSIILSAFYAFNPLIILDSIFWGQVDSILVLLMVLALYYLVEEKIGLSACFFAASILMKPQGIIIAPVLLFELVRKKKLKSFITAGISGIATVALIILPFSTQKGPQWIINLYTNTISEYPKASLNAFNFFSLIGANNVSDTEKLFFMSYHTWGMLFIVLITLLSWFLYIKSSNRLFAPASALLLAAGVFTFASSMHERYLYPAVALAIISFIALRDKRLIAFIIGFSISGYINVQTVLYGTLTAGKFPSFGATQTVISIFNILLFIYLVWVLYDIAVRKKGNPGSPGGPEKKNSFGEDSDIKEAAGNIIPAAIGASRLKNIVTDWAVIIVFGIVVIKTFFITGFILFDETSYNNTIGAFNNTSDPLFYISFILILFSFSYLFAKRGHLWYLIGLDIFISALYIIDTWYLRGYCNLLTLSLTLHTLNPKDITQRLIPSIRPGDFIYLADCVVLFYFAARKKNIYIKMHRSIPLFILMLAVPIGYIYNANSVAEDNHDNLFDVLWAPGETILNLSPIGYHAFDTYDYFSECRTVKLTQERIEAITKWFADKQEIIPDNSYKGLFKGKNLLYIQIESFENFVINQKIDEKEITPNINSLLKNSLYFTNYRDQTNHGNSSDADLVMNASVYPLKEGGTFMLHPYTTYNSLPKLLSKLGYQTMAVKPDKPSGWNWVQALTSMGYQKCIDINSFTVDEKIGLGLSDGSYLKQLEPIIEKQKQPFLTYLVTLSSHSPFELPQKYRELNLTANVEQSSMGGYLESVHYTDKQIGTFLDTLEKAGTLDNTVVVITGDHQGIHKYNYRDYSISSDERQSWWDNNDRRLPLIIWSHGLKGEEITVNGGQVDTLPTLAYLMGVDEEEFTKTSMGRNLLKTNKDFAINNNGGISGNIINEADSRNVLEGFNVADDIIKGDYFKIK